LHDRIASLKKEIWARKTCLAQPLVIEVSVPS